jgi:hypothetical protein
MTSTLDNVLMNSSKFAHCLGAAAFYHAWGIINLSAILQPPLLCFFLFHVSLPMQR